MTGSKGGKHSKRKGKTIKSDTINKEPGVSNSKLDSKQYFNIDHNGSGDPEDKNPQSDISIVLSTSRFSYTERELGDLLYLKVALLYAKAKEELLKLGHSMPTVENAIICAGYIDGHKNFLNNILENSLAYIEKKVEPGKEALKDISEFYGCICETMIQKVMQHCRLTQMSDAVWLLLIASWGIFPSNPTTSHLQRGDMNMCVHEPNGSSINNNEEAGDPNLSSDAVRNKTADPAIEVSDIVSSDFLRSIAGCSSEASLEVWLQRKHEDPKTALIVDLVKDIRGLQEKVKELKEWAEKKATDSNRRLNKHEAELNSLRMEMMDKENIIKEIEYVEKYYILMLIEKEESLRKVGFEVSIHTESMEMLEMDNARMRGNIVGVKLGASKYEEGLREVLKREKRCFNKLVSFENQASILHSQIKEEKQRVLQLEAELLQIDKEGDEVEKKWRHEIREKEGIFALLAEQMRRMEIQRANSRAELLKLQQNIEIDSQLPRDDLQRLEDELACLSVSREKPDVGFWYQIDEASSSTTSAPDESSEKGSRQWICMMCLKIEASVVFLPCKHQVVCSPCYSESFKTLGDRCPYCSAQIEEGIYVYRSSS